MFRTKRGRTAETSGEIERIPEYTPGQLARELTRELEGVDRCFNLVTDPDMIDAYIYERAALMARLRYLLRLEREGEMEYPRLVSEGVEPAEIEAVLTV